MTHPNVTLREVVAVLKRRLQASPLKEYWREEKSTTTGHVDVRGVELTFQGLDPKAVKAAMEGLEQVEKSKFKDRAYTWLLRWEHKSAAIKFRCTLYVYKEGRQHFVFTTVW